MYTPERSQTEIFADNLSRILASKNMSQNQLSKKIEVSAMSVNAWCRGLSMPRNDKIDRMCQVLNLNKLRTPKDTNGQKRTNFNVFDEVSTIKRH